MAGASCGPESPVLGAAAEVHGAAAPYWARYQQIFSAEGLWTCNPQDLKDFANNNTGANTGNQSVFNTVWNAMGDAAAAESTRRTIEYLLYGPEDTPLEDRLNASSPVVSPLP